MAELEVQQTPIEIDDNVGDNYVVMRNTREKSASVQRLEARAERASEPKEESQEPAAPEKEDFTRKHFGQVGVVGKDVLIGATEAPGQAVGGAIDAVNETTQLLKSFENWITDAAAGVLPSIVKDKGGFKVTTLRAAKEKEGIDPDPPAGQLPTTDPADTVTGGLVRGVSQFLVGMAGAKKLLAPVQAVGKGTKLAKDAVAGGMAMATVFDPHEKNLSNLIQEYPALQNPVSEYLAADPTDNEAEARFKLGIEGLGMGAVADGFILGVRTLRTARLAKKTGPTPKQAAENVIVDEANPEKVRQALWEASSEGYTPPKPKGKAVEGIPEALVVTNPKKGENVFINMGRIESDEDVKSVLQTLANSYSAEIKTATRGKITHKKTKLDAFQEDAWEILSSRSKGQPLNNAQTHAVRELWAQSGSSIKRLTNLAAENPSKENLFAFRKQIELHRTIQREVIGARTETARALNAWKIPVGGDKEFAKHIDNMLLSTGGNDITLNMVKKLQKLQAVGAHVEADAFIWGTKWAKTKDMVSQLWYASMLSGPKTHARNVISNVTVVGEQVLERKVAEGFRQMYGGVGVAEGEAAALWHGRIAGTQEALRFTGKGARLAKEAVVLRNRGNYAEASKILAADKTELGSVYKTAITGDSGFGHTKFDVARTGAFSAETHGIDPKSPIGRTMDWIDAGTSSPMRALVTEDELFKTIGYRMELNAQAWRKASREVTDRAITPGEMKARTAELVANPTEEMRLAAQDYAAYATFTNQPGEWGQTLTKLAKHSGAMGVLTYPFRRVSQNIARYGFERTPLAPLVSQWRADIAAGGARADIALARMATGSTLLLVTADLAMNGDITGEGSPDFAERATGRRMGIQPSSIRVPTPDGGERYFSYRGMEPIATTLGLSANIVEILANTDIENGDVDLEKMVVASAMAIAAQSTSQMYMSGVAGLFDAMSDPQRYGESFFQRAASPLVATVGAQAAYIKDPYMREAYSIMDSVKRRTFASDGLPFRRDLWGRKMDRRSGLGPVFDVMSPSRSTVYDPEPIDTELTRMELWLSAPKRNTSFNGIAINLQNHPEAYSRLIELSGNALKETKDQAPIYVEFGGQMDTLNELVTGKHSMSPLYEIGNDDEKADMIDNIRKGYIAAAKDVLLEEYPELKAEYDEKLSEARGY